MNFESACSSSEFFEAIINMYISEQAGKLLAPCSLANYTSRTKTLILIKK